MSTCATDAPAAPETSSLTSEPRTTRIPKTRCSSTSCRARAGDGW
ncbi:hypothetical protein [Nonomuraea salmonea]